MRPRILSAVISSHLARSVAARRSPSSRPVRKHSHHPTRGKMHRTRSRAWLGALSLGLLLASTTAARAQQAIVTGRVTDEAAGQPVSDVQVVVVGTTLGALTNQDGRYTIRGVPAGAQQVRAIRIGYTESKKPVTVV